MRRMLLPTDLSDYSKIVLEFLDDFKLVGVEEVGVLFVIDTTKLSTVSGGFDPSAFIEAEEKRAREEIPKIVEKIESHGMKPIVHEFPTGNPVVEILRFSQHYDFVVMGARGRSLFKEILLGSISESVAMKASVPVYVFKAKVVENEDKRVEKPCERLFERILVAYDFSEHSRVALKYGVEIAEKTGGELVVLYVAEDDRNLEELRPELEGRNINFRLLTARGSPARVIVEKQRELKASTIFLGSRGLGGIKALLGSVSDRVLRMSEVPVLVCR
ncbi:MAG: universal stress protein [Archaeoglobaceae archaeon]